MNPNEIWNYKIKPYVILNFPIVGTAMIAAIIVLIVIVLSI